MIKTVCFWLLFFNCTINHVKAQVDYVFDVKSCASQITSTTSDTFEDLNFLKNELTNKRIVLLGESAHTIADYYKVKTKLVKFLHQSCGFNVFAMESGIADVYTVYKQVDSLSATDLMKKTVFANLACNEMLPLFEFIKSRSNGSLSYCGFDSQNHGSSLEFIRRLLFKYHGVTSDSLVKNLNQYYNIPTWAWQANKEPVIKIADTIKTSAKTILQMLRDIKDTLLETKVLSKMHYNFLERSLINHYEAVNLNWNVDNPLERRDSLMAENVFWIANEIFPEKKIIIWAHNTHIDKSGTDVINKSMGYYINKKFGNDAYHIGMFANTGTLYWWWSKEIRSFNNHQPNDIETIADIYPITFIRTTKGCEINNTVMGFEAEIGRKVAFKPSKRFDAIINFRKVDACTY